MTFLLLQMLQGEEDPETLYPLLISLGTLVPRRPPRSWLLFDSPPGPSLTFSYLLHVLQQMYGDRESTTFVAGMALEPLVHRHRASANAKIAEAAQDVLDLLKW